MLSGIFKALRIMLGFLPRWCSLVVKVTEDSAAAMVVEDNAALEKSLAYLKNLKEQPLSEEIKDEIIRIVENLSFVFHHLQTENERLREEIEVRNKEFLENKKSCSKPMWIQLERERSRASVGEMVDLIDYKKRPTQGRLSTPFPRSTCGPRKPEPLRMRNREQREPPKEVKFSKYSQLPAIKSRSKPKLLRERTYDVIEPIFVKGPLKEEKVKLPEIKKHSKRENTPTSVQRKTPSRSTTATTPKRNKTLQPEPSPVKRTKQVFNPSNVPPSGEIPNNVFWFPM